MFIVSRTKLISLFLFSTAIVVVKSQGSCGGTNPDPNIPCSDGYTCWKDENSDVVWTMGGGAFDTCQEQCANALSGASEFYVCKNDEPIRGNTNALEPITDRLGFNCKSGGCTGDGFTREGEMWIDRTENCDRTCYFPNGGDYYKCDAIVGAANCFGERYTMLCPCEAKPLNDSCEWSCPEYSAPVAKWPENMESGTSCLERINYWRKKACEDGWPECPPTGLPPIVECTSCHQCANSQSEYDAIHGSHASFTRCGEQAQGSGVGVNCAEVIDGFVAEREQFGGYCKGHCTPIVDLGCSTFHWGRTKEPIEPTEYGWYHYTLNWRSCDTDTCNEHCDSAVGTTDACFPSGIDTPSCSDDEEPPTESPVDVPDEDDDDLDDDDIDDDDDLDDDDGDVCIDGEESFLLGKRRGGVKTMTCETLASKSASKITSICNNKVHYHQDGDTIHAPPRAVCPVTCDSCAPCFEHSNTVFFTVRKGKNLYKKCSWLKNQGSKINTICNSNDTDGIYPTASEACPQTCGVCEASD